MTKKSPKFEEAALSNIQTEIETAGAESAEEPDVPNQLALKSKKSKKQRSKAQVEAFARMRARKAALDAEKREKKAQNVAGEPIVLRQYVSSDEEEEEQKPVIRKKKSKKRIVYETESSSSEDEVVAVVKRRKAAKVKKKKSNTRVIYTDELDDSADEIGSKESLGQQYVDVPRQPQLVFL